MTTYHIKDNDRRVVYKTGGRFVCDLGISDKFWDAVDVLSRNNKQSVICGMRVDSVAYIESYECAAQFFDVQNADFSPEFARIDKWVIQVKAYSPTSILLTVFPEEGRDYIELLLRKRHAR